MNLWARSLARLPRGLLVSFTVLEHPHGSMVWPPNPHAVFVSLCVFVDVFVCQAIKQMYVLVLGLDVLGNPFGLIRGLSEGVEAFFYEPYQVGWEGRQEDIAESPLS